MQEEINYIASLESNVKAARIEPVFVNGLDRAQAVIIAETGTNRVLLNDAIDMLAGKVYGDKNPFKHFSLFVSLPRGWAIEEYLTETSKDKPDLLNKSNVFGHILDLYKNIKGEDEVLTKLRQIFGFRDFNQLRENSSVVMKYHGGVPMYLDHYLKYVNYYFKSVDLNLRELWYKNIQTVIGEGPIADVLTTESLEIDLAKKDLRLDPHKYVADSIYHKYTKGSKYENKICQCYMFGMSTEHVSKDTPFGKYWLDHPLYTSIRDHNNFEHMGTFTSFVTTWAKCMYEIGIALFEEHTKEKLEE